MKSDAPPRNASMALSRSAKAVIRMTSTPLPASRSSRNHSMPDLPGRAMSRISRSKCCRSINPRACSTSPATSTRAQRGVSARCRKLRMPSSSSTTRMASSGHARSSGVADSGGTTSFRSGLCPCSIRSPPSRRGLADFWDSPFWCELPHRRPAMITEGGAEQITAQATRGGILPRLALRHAGGFPVPLQTLHSFQRRMKPGASGPLWNTACRYSRSSNSVPSPGVLHTPMLAP
jgi:hypothetical protein